MVFNRKWAHHVGFDNPVCTLTLSTVNTSISIITSNKTHIMELQIYQIQKHLALGLFKLIKHLVLGLYPTLNYLTFCLYPLTWT
jgi:hypothetical protein